MTREGASGEVRIPLGAVRRCSRYDLRLVTRVPLPEIPGGRASSVGVVTRCSVNVGDASSCKCSQMWPCLDGLTAIGVNTVRRIELLGPLRQNCELYPGLLQRFDMPIEVLQVTLQ